MKQVLLALFFTSVSLWAQAFGATLEEEIYTCADNRGETIARVFLDPQIFCENSPVNPATLLRESEHGPALYKGELFRRDDETGENFYYSQIVEGAKLEIFLALSYKRNSTELVFKYDDVVEISDDVTCMMRQVHVSCD